MSTYNVKYFFDFIGKSPAIRLAGFTTVGFFFFGWISYKFWEQHLKDDFERDKENARNIIRAEKAEKKAEDVSREFLDYVKFKAREKDSMLLDNKRFIDELKKQKR